MSYANAHTTTHFVRTAALLLAIACGLVIGAFSGLAGNRAAAQDGAAADRIAFDRNKQIVTANPDGTNQVPLGAGADPSWSKTGKIAFLYTPSIEVSIIAAMNDDGTARTETTTAALNYSPAVSADGSKIAFVSERVEPGDPAGGSRARIYVVNAGNVAETDGSNEHRLFQSLAISGVEQELEPAWSPDGTKVAFVGETRLDGLSDDEIYVANADGSTPPLKITNFGVHGSLRLFRDAAPAWSPDGTKIAFAAARDIHVINADGTGAPVNLTNSTGSDDKEPAWSPDGTKIVYSSNNFTNNALDGIYVMDATGQNQTLVADSQGGANPTWKQRDVSQDPTPTPTPTATPTPTPTATPTPTPTATPTPTPQADLSVLLTAAPNQPSVGSNLIYTLVVRNHGPETATNAAAFFTRPQGVNLVSATAAQGSCQQSPQTPAGTICQLGDLISGAQVSVTVVAQPTAAGEITASAAANSAIDDPEQNNNVQQLKLTVASGCVEEVTASVGQQIVRNGNQSRKQLEHTIYVRNNSGHRLNGLVHFVFDGLPASVEGDKGTTFFRTRCAQPLGRKYTSVGVGLNDLVWEPGQLIKLKVDFFNPGRAEINYNLRIYTGPGFP
ncbi:MAG TPA: hypothetical protein VM864_05525 [Pyrinomonadaceae bacterium]|jgi:uncharacterized repeat protein (TIGR01451 family)|nr:hypothetical protein [Pyrinomonadaceae bacterium]